MEFFSSNERVRGKKKEKGKKLRKKTRSGV